MQRQTNWHRPALLPRAALAASLLASLLPAQQKERLRVDDARLRTMVDRIAPAVERASGRQFRKPPVAQLADLGDVMRSLRTDIEPSLRAFHRGQPQARIQRAIQLRADVLAASLIGKYGIGSGEIYVLAHMVDANLDLFGIDRELGEDLLQLVIAHELVHALQDQEIELAAKVAATTDLDRTHALNMLIEGHAVFCSERAAKELGIERAIEPLRRIFIGRTTETQLTSQIALRSMRHLGTTYYLDGAALFTATVDADGVDAAWRLLADTVPESRRLLLPDAVPPPPSDPLPALDGIESLFGQGNWTIGRGSVGAIQLRSELLPKVDDLSKLLPQLSGGAVAELRGASQAVWALVMVLAFADAGAADRFVALAEDAAGIDASTLHRELPAGVRVDFAGGDAKAPDGIAGRRWTQQPQRAPGLTRCELSWFRRGRHVLQLTQVTTQLDDERLLQLVAKVFASLPE